MTSLNFWISVFHDGIVYADHEPTEQNTGLEILSWSLECRGNQVTFYPCLHVWIRLACSSSWCGSFVWLSFTPLVPSQWTYPLPGNWPLKAWMKMATTCVLVCKCGSTETPIGQISSAMVALGIKKRGRQYQAFAPPKKSDQSVPFHVHQRFRVSLAIM